MALLRKFLGLFLSHVKILQRPSYNEYILSKKNHLENFFDGICITLGFQKASTQSLLPTLSLFRLQSRHDSWFQDGIDFLSFPHDIIAKRKLRAETPENLSWLWNAGRIHIYVDTDSNSGSMQKYLIRCIQICLRVLRQVSYKNQNDATV